MKITKRIAALLISVMLLFSVIGGVNASAATVYYEFPFADHDNWYTYVDGWDEYTTGYLTSPSKFLDFTYKDGVASMFFTGKSLEYKAYQNGSQYGWPWMFYTYDTAKELDLTNIAFEYEIAAQMNWQMYFVLEYKDDSNSQVALHMSSLTDIPAFNLAVEEPVITKGRVEMLDAVKKNLSAHIVGLGLNESNTVKLKTIAIQAFLGYNFGGDWARNEYRNMRFVKDTSIGDKVKTPAEDDTSSEESSSVTSSEPPKLDDGTDRFTSDATNIQSSSEESSSEDTSSDNSSVDTDIGTGEKNGVSPLWIIIPAAVVVIGGGAVAVVLIGKRKKQ